MLVYMRRKLLHRLYHECLNCPRKVCDNCHILDEYVKEVYEVFAENKWENEGKGLAQQAAEATGTKNLKEDVVNSPSHYKVFPDMEAIDIIEKVLTDEEFKGYCKGNFLKYRLRAGEKDEVGQEIDKSNVYREWLYD